MRLRSLLFGVVVPAALIAGTTTAMACPSTAAGCARVHATRDLRGGPKGYAIARFSVVEDVIGRVSAFVRVRFYRPTPKDANEELISPHAVLNRGERWALVSRQRANGLVEFGLVCSDSQSFGKTRFRNLVRLARVTLA